VKRCSCFSVSRFESNPIIYPDMLGLAGELGANINGPSLIRVPDWVERPLGKYYLYFAHHGVIGNRPNPTWKTSLSTKTKQKNHSIESISNE